jgi:hypothetical protein
VTPLAALLCALTLATALCASCKYFSDAYDPPAVPGGPVLIPSDNASPALTGLGRVRVLDAGVE